MLLIDLYVRNNFFEAEHFDWARLSVMVALTGERVDQNTLVSLVTRTA